MKKILTLAFVIIGLSINSFAQEIEAITEDGKKVILHENGTWKYQELLKSKNTINHDCKDIITVETDKMTGETNIHSKMDIKVSDDGGKTGLEIYPILSKNIVLISIQVIGGGHCIGKDEKSNILFRDGTRLELTNDREYNCDGLFTLYFGSVYGKRKEIIMLGTKEIETMRVWTSSNYIQSDFTNEQSNRLMKTIQCLIDKT